jgi:multidrug resistance efflux pump
MLRCGDERQATATDPPRIELRATVANPQTASAVASIDGRVATLTVSEGAHVTQGQLLATLTNPSIERDLAYARAQVAVAEQRLRDARKPIATSLILGDAGARERASQEILKNRESRRDRYRELYASHDVSKEELENAENEYAAALRDWLGEHERASMKVVNADTSVLQLELEKAKAEQAFVADRKTLLNITAPLAGTITRVPVHLGDSIFTRDPVAEIANTSTIEIHAPIAPELTKYVPPGTQVEVKVLTVPPRVFRVPVKSVANGTLVVEVPNPEGAVVGGAGAVVTVK